MKKIIIPDDPINNFEDDILGREEFAKNLAESLTEWKEKKSLVIGLFGKWGSGKTSVLNLTKKYLKAKENKERKDNPIMVDFNPWGYSETDDLLPPFIGQIKAAVDEKDGNKFLKKVSGKFNDYLLVINKSHPLKTISSLLKNFSILLVFMGLNSTFGILGKWASVSWIGPIAFILAFVLWIIKIIIKKNSTKKSLPVIKQEINDILTTNNIRLIIIIDDIDRLTSAEIKQLFRIIRINADFPNTIYLLSFDRNIVEKSLNVQDTISGHDYLGKIINIEYDLPGISQFRLEKYFKNNLEKMISQLPKEADNIFSKEEVKWAFIYPIIISELSSIRDIKRFFNAISFKLNQFINKNILEINLVDLFGIELLRLKYPECYSFIRDNKPRFLSLKKETDNEKETYVKWFNDSFNSFSSNSIHTTNIITIITQLFPIAYYKSKNIPISSVPHTANDVTCSIASERFFDIYFDHISSISAEECSNYDAQRIKAVSNDYETLKNLLREYIDNHKIHSLIDLLEKHSIEGDLIPKENYLSYFAALFDIINEIPDWHERLQFGNDTIIHRIVYFLIRFNNKNENAELFEKLIDKTENPFMCSDFIENEIINYKEQKEGIIARTRIPYLQQKVVEKIHKCKAKLLDSKYFIRLLYFWRENDFLNYERYIYGLTRDINNLLKAIERSVRYVYSTAANNKEKIEKKINYDDIKLLGDLGDILNRLHLIRFGNGDLYRKNKEVIDLFLDNYKINNKKV